MQNNDQDEIYQIPDSLWAQIKPLLPSEIPRSGGGRPGIDQRKAMDAILNIFRFGCMWKSLPRCLGSSEAVKHRLREWQEAGVFQRMWQAGILTYDEMRKMVWYGRKWRMPGKS